MANHRREDAVIRRTMRASALEHRIPPPIVAAAFAGVAWAIAGTTPALDLPRSLRLVLGGLFVLAAAGLLAKALREFRRARTTIHPLEPERASAIVSSGVFALSRNPMYLALVLALLGWTVYLAAPAALIAPAGLVAYLTRFQIVPEERVLAAKFGRAYDEYRARVRRWV